MTNGATSVIAARPMRIVFAGTPLFARVALEALHAAGHDVALVLTQPDRPAGRGMKLQMSAVKQFAEAHGMQVCQPRSLRLDGKYPDDAQIAQNAITQAGADVMVVAAYGLILPLWVLGGFKLGCINIHASLLPRWRGAAPIHRAIEAGDEQTGITIMQMDVGLDTGDMLLSKRVDIGPDDTTASLHDRLAELGGQLAVQALELARQGRLQPIPQPKDLADPRVTYAAKIDKAEATIDWCRPAQDVVRHIHALNPAPGASSLLKGDAVKIWRAEALPMSTLPGGSPVAGQILGFSNAGIAVSAINSVVNIIELQKPGGKRLGAADFLRGTALKVGDCFAQHANDREPTSKPVQVTV